VRADAPYKTERTGRGDQGEPGQVQGLGTGQGGHLAPRIAGMLKDLKSTRPPRRGCRRTAPRRGCRIWSPVASRFVPCSLPEARSLIDAGKVKSLRVATRRPRCTRTCRR